MHWVRQGFSVYLLYRLKLDWTQAGVFVKIPPLFQLLLFGRILPCSEPFAILAGIFGLPALVDLRRRSFAWVLRAVRNGTSAAMAGRTIRCRPAFARHGRRLKKPSFGVSATKPGKSRPIAARNRRLTITSREGFLHLRLLSKDAPALDVMPAQRLNY